MCLSVCGRSARSRALSDNEGASMGAASNRSDRRDFNNGRRQQRQTHRQRKREAQSWDGESGQFRKRKGRIDHPHFARGMGLKSLEESLLLFSLGSFAVYAFEPGQITAFADSASIPLITTTISLPYCPFHTCTATLHVWTASKNM